MSHDAGHPPQVLRTPSSYADQIAQILEQEILDGRYRRGEHLQQDEVCRRFGVSRTPAREALRKLQALGLVELIPNRGAMVQLPTLKELTEVYRVRAELEGFAAELAAASRDDAMVARLRQAQQNLAEVVATVSSAADKAEDAATNEHLRGFNDAFHEIIHGAGGNQQLSRMIHDLQRYFPKDTVRLAVESPDALQSLYLDEHVVILDEIAAGRASRARAAMRDHIHRAEALMIGFLRQRGLED